jgi:nucleoid-associated protein YgaU
MARETKVGLLVGLCFVLLIGILISDQLSNIQTQEPAALNTLTRPVPERATTSVNNPSASQGSRAIPTPDEVSPPHQPETFTDLQTGRLLQNVVVSGPNAIEQQTPVVAQVDTHAGVRPIDETGSLSARPLVQQQPTAQTRTIVQSRKHEVAEGEYLTEISRLYYGDSQAWRRIRDANPDLISEEGGVRAGAVLVIPPAPSRDTAGTPSRVAELESTGLFERVGPQPAPIGTVTSTRQTATIKVEAGDNLSQLAGRHLGSSARWRELMDANKDQLKRDTDLRAGMVLKLPSGSATTPAVASRETPRRAPAAYTVQKGDSLSKIAEAKLGDKDEWRSIYNLNKSKIDDPANIKAGLVLLLP